MKTRNLSIAAFSTVAILAALTFVLREPVRLSFAQGPDLGPLEILAPSYVWTAVNHLDGVKAEIDCVPAIQSGTDAVTVVFSNFKPTEQAPEFTTKKLGGAQVTVNGFRMRANKMGSVYTLSLPQGWTDQGVPLNVLLEAFDTSGSRILYRYFQGVEQL